MIDHHTIGQRLAEALNGAGTGHRATHLGDGAVEILTMHRAVTLTVQDDAVVLLGVWDEYGDVVRELDDQPCGERPDGDTARRLLDTATNLVSASFIHAEPA